MKQLCLLVWAILFPLLAHAVPLRVQTGEHADFSRVVVAIPPELGWAFGRDETGYALRVETDAGFDLRGFYDLIPRDRILEVSQDASSGELRLRIDCPCHASAEVYRNRYLVIDVRDGPAPAGSAFEARLPVRPAAAMAQPRPQTSDDAGVLQPPFRRIDEAVLPLITPRFSPFPTDPGRQSDAPPVVAPMGRPKAEVSEPATEDALTMIAQSLGESLGRALSDGLLAEDIEGLRGAVAADDGPDTGRARAPRDFPGLDARSSIDPLAITARAAPPQTQVGQACLDPEYFNVSAWGSDGPPHLQLQDARRRLSDASDQLVSAEALALARLYVYLGFGREAVQVLDLDGTQSRARLMLRQIALLIDNESVQPTLFADQVSCPTAVALWALLAQPAAPLDAQVNRRAVVNAFRALPVNVQRPIAPRVAEALLRIGAEDEALQILGRSDGGGPDELSFALAEAALSDALGENEAAIATLTAAVRSVPRPTAEAMTRFFKEGVANGMAFTDEDFVMADALRFELAGSEQAVQIADVQFQALLSVDRFMAARTLLDQRDDPAARQGQQRATMLEQATQRMPDAAFLEFVWTADLHGLGADVQNKVAERLLDLGFPRRALLVMTDTAQGATATQQTALRARAARTQEAVSAQAMVSPARPDAALTVDADPSGITPGGNPVLRESRALVGDAERTRDAIRALLREAPAPSEF